MQGDNLAPLSHRDMWILKRASRLAKHVPQLSNPTYDRWDRHVHDWLRNEVEGAEGDPLPHWVHSWDPEHSEYNKNSSDLSLGRRPMSKSDESFL